MPETEAAESENVKKGVDAATESQSNSPPKEKKRKILFDRIAKVTDDVIRGELNVLTEMLFLEMDEKAVLMDKKNHELDKKNHDIAVLTTSKALSDARAYALKLKLGGRGTIENKEQDIFSDWLTRNETLARGQKWLIAIILKLTPSAAAMNEKLSKLPLNIILFCEFVDQFYDKWSKYYHKSRLKAPENDATWNELYDMLDIENEKAKMAIKVIVSEYSEEGKKFDDQNVIDENTDKEKPAKRYGFLRRGAFAAAGTINNIAATIANAFANAIADTAANAAANFTERRIQARPGWTHKRPRASIQGIEHEEEDEGIS